MLMLYQRIESRDFKSRYPLQQNVSNAIHFSFVLQLISKVLNQIFNIHYTKIYIDVFQNDNTLENCHAFILNEAFYYYSNF